LQRRRSEIGELCKKVSQLSEDEHRKIIARGEDALGCSMCVISGCALADSCSRVTCAPACAGCQSLFLSEARLSSCLVFMPTLLVQHSAPEHTCTFGCTCAVRKHPHTP
jgi:hypothetical protein